MNIESPRFGTLSIEPSKIIEFPEATSVKYRRAFLGSPVLA